MYTCNWNILFSQSCKGGDECNCFVGNEFMGYRMYMNDNKKNISECISWMEMRNCPPIISVSELKRYVSSWKIEQGMEEKWRIEHELGRCN